MRRYRPVTVSCTTRRADPPYDGRVHGVINGDDWIRQRMQHLQELLGAGGVSEADRAMIEAELAVLESERGIKARPAIMAVLLRQLSEAFPVRPAELLS